MRIKVLVSAVLILALMQSTACIMVNDPIERTNSVQDEEYEDREEVQGEQTSTSASYSIVDTGQINTFGSAPGQDADVDGNQPTYVDNGDGTVTDLVTGLMWEQGYSLCDFDEAEKIAEQATTGGYDDWRVPTIKELYSLIDFSGNQGTGPPESNTLPSDAIPFINTDFFSFEYSSNGLRYIDAQYISSTEYVSITMNGAETFFGVNFADGRIKGYPQTQERKDNRWCLRLVRGGNDYGENQYVDNKDGTVTDQATELMWTQADSGDDIFSAYMTGYSNQDGGLDWYEALSFAQSVSFAGYDDWRLPNAKELQSIVDYSRSPDTTDSAAINKIFESTQIVNEAGQSDYAFYWTSTTFEPGRDAVYIAFGRALGYMNGEFMDVHGAGAQRTDPKTGGASYGNGPQGDVRRVYNYVRLVRDA